MDNAQVETRWDPKSVPRVIIQKANCVTMGCLRNAEGSLQISVSWDKVFFPENRVDEFFRFDTLLQLFGTFF